MMKIFGNKFSLKPKHVFCAGVVLLAVLLVFGVLSVYTYAHKDIFPRVTAMGVRLGGMNEEEAVKALDEECKSRYEDAKLLIKLEDIDERSVSSDELALKFSSSEIAEKAMEIGHRGGFFKRIGEVTATVFTGTGIDSGITADEQAIKNVTDYFAKKDIEPVDASYEVTETELVLYPKTDGRKIDAEALADVIKERFNLRDYSDLTISREEIESKNLDIDKVYEEVHKEAADARLEKQENENIIVPHVVGIDFDVEAARIAYETNPDEIIRIPLEVTEPKVKTKDLEANLFKYVLADVTTYFSPKKVERTANVRLAAKLVNGVVLNPGEEFSYNTSVGPRTEARGFKAAAIFASGEVVDGIGGGICQVSSTLYMAAIKANMKITERKNHTFYVDYAPKGEDATVVYGSIDFRFVNTSPYPIKIVTSSKDNYIRVKLMGTETDKFTVKLSKKTLSTKPFEERIKNVATLKAGERHVEQEGQEGLVMEVYRNVYNADGKLISSKFENKSTYKPMPQIIHVGTAAATDEPSVPAVTDPGADTTSSPEESDKPESSEDESVKEDEEKEATEIEIEKGEDSQEIPDWLVPSDSTQTEQ